MVSLVSIDGVPIGRIMEFAQKEFGNLARKRFAEVLVEVMSSMGHDPAWTGQVEHVRAQMTKENCDLVRK